MTEQTSPSIFPLGFTRQNLHSKWRSFCPPPWSHRSREQLRGHPYITSLKVGRRGVRKSFLRYGVYFCLHIGRRGVKHAWYCAYVIDGWSQSISKELTSFLLDRFFQSSTCQSIIKYVLFYDLKVFFIFFFGFWFEKFTASNWYLKSNKDWKQCLKLHHSGLII